MTHKINTRVYNSSQILGLVLNALLVARYSTTTTRHTGNLTCADTSTEPDRGEITLFNYYGNISALDKHT